MRDGDDDRARLIADGIRAAAGTPNDRPLPTTALHRASYPNAKTRPTLIALPQPTPARELPVRAVPDPTPPPPAPQREIPQRPLMSRAELIEMHIDLQQQLALYGIVKTMLDQQHRLDRELMRAYQIDPFGEALDLELERLHREAYPGPHRLPRLVARDGVVALEDLLVD